MSKKKFQEPFMDNRVQLFLGKFLGGELNNLSPVLDRDLGYRYPEVEGFVNKPEEAEPFLRSLEGLGLMTSEVCGNLVCCTKCGSCLVDRVSSLSEGMIWRCRGCGASVNEGDVAFLPVSSYSFSEKGIAKISDALVIKPLREFLLERGYRIESPGALVGESDVEHSFDVLAYGGESDEGVLAIDFVVSNRQMGESKVVSMFAKVYDTSPLKSVLVAFPGLTDTARKLANQYGIELVETSNVSSMWKELRKVIPPVEEFRFEALDVMTLLSLPDHLRKTATVTSKLGRATANEISRTTKRARAVESGYLNQLVRMGYLRKERSGRKVLFSVVS
mgnify:CR=1 FL=1